MFSDRLIPQYTNSTCNLPAWRSPSNRTDGIGKLARTSVLVDLNPFAFACLQDYCPRWVEGLEPKSLTDRCKRTRDVPVLRCVYNSDLYAVQSSRSKKLGLLALCCITLASNSIRLCVSCRRRHASHPAPLTHLRIFTLGRRTGVHVCSKCIRVHRWHICKVQLSGCLQLYCSCGIDALFLIGSWNITCTNMLIAK